MLSLRHVFFLLFVFFAVISTAEAQQVGTKPGEKARSKISLPNIFGKEEAKQSSGMRHHVISKSQVGMRQLQRPKMSEVEKVSVPKKPEIPKTELQIKLEKLGVDAVALEGAVFDHQAQ